MALTITLTVGIPASGKTTWAENQVVNGQGNIVNINRDDIREMLYGACRQPLYTFSKGRETVVREIQVKIANAAASSKKNIIISDTNLDPDRAELWGEWAKAHGYQLKFKSFIDVPLNILLERDALRKNGVGADVIRMYWNKYIKPNLPQEERKTYTPNHSLPTAFIVDVDGTVANMNGKRSPYEWDKVDLDEPCLDVMSLVMTLFHAGHKIIFASGRDEVCREKTLSWLESYKLPVEELFMRPEGDQRKDSEVKEEIFWNDIAPKWKVVGVLDDRNQVVDMWRSLGLRCYAVAAGDF
jgi:predicted kinase